MTNVVALSSSKLTERIAVTAAKPSAMPANEDDEKGLVAFTASKVLPIQDEAVNALSSAIASDRRGSNVLIIGPPGSGRRTTAARIVEARRGELERPKDWLYVTAPGESRRLVSRSVPHGQGALFVREVRAAMGRAEANHARLVAADDYRLGLEIIDEEFRHRSSKSLDLLKRRAEAQNIAMVKTPEGFVLAPMLDGKVVRKDVFRALPDALQREVEAKIKNLEVELKKFVDAQPDEDAAQGERIAVFNRETASRAVKSQFEAVRAAFSGTDEIIDSVEASLISAIASGGRVHEGALPRQHSDVAVLGAQLAEDFSEAAPLVVAHDVSPAALMGTFGRDGAGQLKFVPGALARANGGFLMIEAWRLVALPESWLALSGALEMGEIKPIVPEGTAVEVEPVPLSIKVLLVADDHAIKRLSDIDPGVLRFFPHIARFQAVAPRSALSDVRYAEIAAAIAARKQLRPLARSSTAALYDIACVSNSISLNLTDLTALLFEADRFADDARSSVIRGEDIKAAATRIREVREP